MVVRCEPVLLDMMDKHLFLHEAARGQAGTRHCQVACHDSKSRVLNSDAHQAGVLEYWLDFTLKCCVRQFSPA